MPAGHSETKTRKQFDMQPQILYVTMSRNNKSGFSVTLITARTGPAEAAGTVASGGIAFYAMAAVAAVETVDPEPARRAVWNQTAHSRTLLCWLLLR